MNLQHFINPNTPSSLDFEIVERKGRGHPDTLADRLAEKLSVAYSNFTKNETGVILRHQFDKLLLMGGRCSVSFGHGTFNSPIRIVINGRMTQNFGTKKINFRDLIFNECETFLESELRNFRFLKDSRIIFETTSHSTRGLIDNTGNSSINYRFSPRNAADLPESSRPLSNDTALGHGFAPYTKLEKMVLNIENSLTTSPFINENKWIGTDIKIMACRLKGKVDITLAIPQICTEVNSANEYLSNSVKLTEFVSTIINKYPEYETRISINPSDNPSKDLVYLRYTGSCIESGDEGAVARGNRIGGLISSCRAYSIEGLNGKNPAYHAGKLYSVIAWEIAHKLFDETNTPCEVFIISQIDRPIDDPWKIIINSSIQIDESLGESVVKEILSDIDTITNKLLSGLYPLV